MPSLWPEVSGRSEGTAGLNLEPRRWRGVCKREVGGRKWGPSSKAETAVGKKKQPPFLPHWDLFLPDA